MGFTVWILLYGVHAMGFTLWVLLHGLYFMGFMGFVDFTS